MLTGVLIARGRHAQWLGIVCRGIHAQRQHDGGGSNRATTSTASPRRPTSPDRRSLRKREVEVSHLPDPRPLVGETEIVGTSRTRVHVPT